MLCMDLRLSGKEIDTVFRLNGVDENSVTFAFGWALSRSPILLRTIIYDLAKCEFDPELVSIELQKFGKDKGFTDIEIFIPKFLHIVIEAKQHWELPPIKQLEKYAKRLNTRHISNPLLVTLSAASRGYAQRRLPSTINLVPVVHRSWADLHTLVNQAYCSTKSMEEKLWLREFKIYLRGFVSMRNLQDNRVYVVALSKEPIKEDEGYTWIDVVERDNCYFHPIRKGWPVMPPNYIAFRYDGQLQSVHHIESYNVIADLSSCNEFWPESDADHFVYQLGPAIKPFDKVKSGRIWNRRGWCCIDTLLSGACKSVKEAMEETNRRLGDKLD